MFMADQFVLHAHDQLDHIHIGYKYQQQNKNFSSNVYPCFYIALELRKQPNRLYINNQVSRPLSCAGF